MLLLTILYEPGATQAEKELYDANGPLWYRGWALESEEQVCVDVEKVLARTGTRRMIMGHTPDFNVSCRSSARYKILMQVYLCRALSLGATERSS